MSRTNERERVTVLHYDGDYELIAQVTGQPVQWVVPRGNGSLISQNGKLSPVNELCAAEEENQSTSVLSSPTVAKTGRPGGKGQSPVVPERGSRSVRK